MQLYAEQLSLRQSHDPLLNILMILSNCSHLNSNRNNAQELITPPANSAMYLILTKQAEQHILMCSVSANFLQANEYNIINHNYPKNLTMDTELPFKINDT